MDAKIERDELGKTNWNQSYVLTREKNLWGDPPVPFVEDAIRLFSADGAKKVLDLPCGDGRNLAPLARKFEQVYALDSSANALTIARKYSGAAGLVNVVFDEANIFNTGMGDNTFDGIFCCDVIGHLTRPRKAIEELLRICRPGKCVMANVFAMGDDTRGPNMVLVGNEEYIFDDRFYFKFYEREDVDLLLAGISAEVLSVGLTRWMEPPHEGYREYEHEHESWLFAIRKNEK